MIINLPQLVPPSWRLQGPTPLSIRNLIPLSNTSTLPTVAQQDSEPRKVGVFNLRSLFIKLLR